MSESRDNSARSRIVAFVDHEIGHRLLEKILSQRASLDFELVAVVTTTANGTQWWPGVEALCERNAITLHRYNEPFEATFDYADVDWYFLLSWKYLIPPRLIAHPKRGAINLHYALLPEYRGVYPVNWAIIEGRDRAGVTYHLVDENIDTGPILAQRDAPIYLHDTARTLQLRLDDVAYELFDDVLEWTLRDKPLPPPPSPTGRRSYRSYADFAASNELDLDREYRAGDLLNLLRGKTFLAGSENLYAIDPATGDRIYISIDLKRVPGP